MKKHITRLLFAALLLLALCIGASAAGTSGKCGPSACWSFDSSTGTLTISGSGAMDDYGDFLQVPWKDYRLSLRTVVIKEGITHIGADAFTGTTLRGDLTLPDSLLSVGDEAFWGQNGLTGKLTLGKNLQKIGKRAFALCCFSDDLIIPDSVTEIDDFAFSMEMTISPQRGTLTLGNNLRMIGREAFSGCLYTGSLVIPDSVVEIRDAAFYGCSALNGTLTLGKNIKTLGESVFCGCSFTGDLIIPDNITQIPDSTFLGCFRIQEGTPSWKLTLPAALKTIGAKAFANCNGFSGALILPDGLTSIGDDTFYGCDGFSGSLVLPEGLTSIGDRAFCGCDGFYGKLVLPEGLTSIGAAAFENCDGFGGTLSLPDSVKTVGESAFYLCKGFTGLKLPAGLTKIEKLSFAHMYGLQTEVVIPEGVTELGEGAFECSYMPSVSLPSTLKKIGKQAFHLAGLTKITLPNGMETIGDEAFDSCRFKKAIVLPASIKSIGKKAFYGYSYYGSGTLGAYFLGAAPQLVGTVNANCSFPSDWTLYYLPGTSGWTGEAYEGYRIAPWDGETRWDNLYTRRFGRDNRGDEIGTSWAVNTDTGKITLTDDLNEGCAVAVSYDEEGRVTRIGVLRTREDSAVLSLQDTCRLFLLSASFAPRLNAPVIINDYLPI